MSPDPRHAKHGEFLEYYYALDKGLGFVHMIKVQAFGNKQRVDFSPACRCLDIPDVLSSLEEGTISIDQVRSLHRKLCMYGPKAQV